MKASSSWREPIAQGFPVEDENLSTLPGSWYVGSPTLDRERERVFGRSWQLAGCAEDVARPGGCLAVEVAGDASPRSARRASATFTA